LANPWRELGEAVRVHDVALEYGAKRRDDDVAPAPPDEAREGAAAPDDIPF
jgi:hypothetical protein